MLRFLTLQKTKSAKTNAIIKRIESDYFRLFKRVVKMSIFGLMVFLLHRQSQHSNDYEIECVKCNTNNYLLEKIGSIDYRPSLFMPSCLSQMIYNEVKNSPQINYRRELIKTNDGAVISLDWVDHGSDMARNKFDKILVILHGLTGGSESTYIRDIVEEYKVIEGFKVVVVNYRGVNDTPLYTPETYHAGYIDDIHTAMVFIKANYPHVNCYTLGTSMGANIFTKLFTHTDEFNSYVKGFISISNPLHCSEVEKRNRGSYIDYFLIRRQLKFVEKHQHVLKEKVDLNEIRKINNFRDYDRLVTIKLFKFESVEEYYKKSSSYEDIEHIQIPSLFFNAKNDILSPIDTVNLDKTFRKNPNVILILTRLGGHVCWFYGVYNPKRVK